MENKTVLVTGTGGNVGQGILRNIKNLKLPIRIVGTNVKEFSAGNHLCAVNYKLPFAYQENYIEAVNQIVEQEKVDLIIPSTDFETYYLSKNSSKIDATIAVSDVETTEIYLDKYKSFLHHQKNNIPFADSFLPSEFANQYENFIVKPRQGRGSRGIFINPTNVKSFSDKDDMVQELVKGKEITTAFYVNKQKQLHGFITMERSLENGTTNECKVINDYDKSLHYYFIKNNR
jgi:carbamoyl-phosphate synthase large subunit